jgi:hypothetical protein
MKEVRSKINFPMAAPFLFRSVREIVEKIGGN